MFPGFAVLSSFGCSLSRPVKIAHMYVLFAIQHDKPWWHYSPL